MFLGVARGCAGALSAQLDSIPAKLPLLRALHDRWSRMATFAPSSAAPCATHPLRRGLLGVSPAADRWRLRASHPAPTSTASLEIFDGPLSW